MALFFVMNIQNLEPVYATVAMPPGVYINQIETQAVDQLAESTQQL